MPSVAHVVCRNKAYYAECHYTECHGAKIGDAK
jgi:hypothetical protein